MEYFFVLSLKVSPLLNIDVWYSKRGMLLKTSRKFKPYTYLYIYYIFIFTYKMSNWRVPFFFVSRTQIHCIVQCLLFLIFLKAIVALFCLNLRENEKMARKRKKNKKKEKRIRSNTSYSYSVITSWLVVG